MSVVNNSGSGNGNDLLSLILVTTFLAVVVHAHVALLVIFKGKILGESRGDNHFKHCNPKTNEGSNLISFRAQDI